MFGNDPVAVAALISSTLEWDSWAQMSAWQLLAIENSSDLQFSCKFLPLVLNSIDTNSHFEALTGISAFVLNPTVDLLYAVLGSRIADSNLLGVFERVFKRIDSQSILGVLDLLRGELSGSIGKELFEQEVGFREKLLSKGKILVGNLGSFRDDRGVQDSLKLLVQEVPELA